MSLRGWLGISQLTMRNLDEAHRSFDAVLAEKPTNLIALMGKVRPKYPNIVTYPHFLIGQDTLRSPPVPAGAQALPASTPTEPSLSSRPAHRDWSLPMGNGLQGEGAGSMAAQHRSRPYPFHPPFSRTSLLTATSITSTQPPGPPSCSSAWTR